MSIKNYISRGIEYILTGQPINNIVANVSFINSDELLSGKKVIITGGGRGLGYSMAKSFKDCGAKVLIAGRNEDTLKHSAEQLSCKYLKLDLQQFSQFNCFIEEANELLDGANCLVNNAGISLHEPTFLDVSETQFDSQFNTNLKGPFFLSQAFIQMLMNRENHSGKILFISSETGTTVDERPYGLTKVALNSLVQGLAYRYVKYGLRINAICPGVTTSDMTMRKEDENLFYKSGITKRVYLSGEVAEVAKFILSDASNLINGQLILTNEGKTINARIKY